MKRFWYLLLVLMLLIPPGLSAQFILGSSSPWKFENDVLKNRTSLGSYMPIRFYVRNNGVEEALELVPSPSGIKYLAGILGTDKWWLGTVGAPFDRIYGDSLIISSRLTFNGETFSDLTGFGTRNNGGQFEVYLPNLIGSTWITDQTLTGADVDSTSQNFVFDGAYEGTSGVADSQYATKRYSRLFIGNKPVTGATPTNGQILKYDSGTDSLIYDNEAGAAGGDAIFVDTGDGINLTVTDPVFRGAIVKTGDTLDFQGGTSSAIELDGDTTSAAATFNLNNSRIDSLKFMDVDSIHADAGIVTPMVDSVAEVSSAENTNMILKTVGGHPANTGIWLQYGSVHGVRFFENTTQTLSIDGDSIVGNSAGGNIIKGFKYGVFSDSGASGGMVVAGQKILGDSSIASEGEMTDYVSSNYVSKVNENVLRGATADLKVIFGETPGDTALKIERFNEAGTDSTRITAIGRLILRATIPEAATFDSIGVANYMRMNGTGGIKDALYGSFDTVQVDRQFRFNGATSGFLRMAAPATVTNYDLIMPSALGSGGYLYFNSAGVGSFAAGGVGGGGDTLWSGINAQTGQRADSIQYVSRAGDAIIMVGDSGTYTQLSSADNTGGFQLVSPLRTQAGEVIDSDDSSFASEREVAAYATANYFKKDSAAWHHKGATNPRDTIQWSVTGGGVGAEMSFTYNGDDTLKIKPGTSTGTVVIGNEGLTTADSLNILSKLYIFGKVWPTSFSAGQQLTIDGSGNYSWADPAGVSAGTGDTVIFNITQTTTGTEYSSVSNKLKVREGNAIDITREDSTSFDLIRFNALYDGSTIGLNGSNQLYVPNSGIGANQLATGAATNTKIGTNAITNDKMDDNSVGTSEVINSSLLFADWAQNGASTGHVPAWNGSAWAAKFIDSTNIPNLGIPPRNISQAGASPGDLMGWNGSTWAPTGGAGTGTITSVGSRTSGAAFSSVASSHGQWFGMQDAVGWPRFYFDSTSITSYGRDVRLLGANLRIGQRTDNAKTGIIMASDSSVNNGDFGIWANNLDSGNGDKTQIQLSGTANAAVTTGGDVGILLATNNSTATWGLGYGIGIDWSDGKRLKFMANSDGTIGTTGDYFAMDSTGKAVFWGGLYLGNEAMTVSDSLAATLRYARTGGYQTEYIGINGGHVYWTPEPMASVAKFMSWPWVDTTGTYTRVDSMIARTYLWRVTDTTASNDTLFVVTQWQADVACSLLAVNYAGKTSSATAGTSSLDSVVIHVNGTRIQGIKPAFASTVLDTIAINFTDIQLNAQDLVTLEWRYVLGNDATADCKWANIERRKR